MDINSIIVLVKGGGDLGTGVAWKLYRSGIKVIVMDLPNPLSIRRYVSFSTAIDIGTHIVDGVKAQYTKNTLTLKEDLVHVITTDQTDLLQSINISICIDATLKGIDNRTTSKGDAPFTIGLGPGFKAPENIDCVIETKRGHNLGRVIYVGEAEKYTGIPGEIEGYTFERLIRSPTNGKFKSLKKIGDILEKNELIGWVNQKEVRSSIHGIIRGLIKNEMHIQKGFKMGDIDPRGIKDNIYTVSDKARNIGGGALEAILFWVKKN